MAKNTQNPITRIQMYRSPTAGRKPALADLADGELALNSADGAMFSRAGNTIYNVGIPSNADFESLNNMTFANVTSTGQIQIGRNVSTENRIWFGGTDVANSGVVRCSAAQQMVISAPPKADSNTQVIFLRPRGDTTATNQTTITGTGILTSRALASETTLTVAGASTFSGTVALNNTVTINATGAFTNAATSTFTGTVNLNGSVSVNATGTFSVASSAEFTAGFTARAGLELYGTTPYIDFHHGNNSTVDYTSRLITSGTSELSCVGSFKVTSGITAGGTLTAATTVMVTAANNANAHLSFNTVGTGARTRGLIYSEPAGAMVFIPNNDALAAMTLQPAGHIYLGGNVDAAYVKSRGAIQATGNVHAGSSFMAVDGNINGAAYGGYLTTWVQAQINAVNNNANAKVGDIRLTAPTVVPDSGGRIDLGTGEVYTGMSGANYWVPGWARKSTIQKFVGDQWYTIGGY